MSPSSRYPIAKHFWTTCSKPSITHITQPLSYSHRSIGRGHDFLDDCGLVAEPSYPQCKEEDPESLKQLMIAVGRRAGRLV
jgi:hypothetical protein